MGTSVNEFEETENPSDDPNFTRQVVRSKRGRPVPWLHVADTQRALAVGIVIATLLLYGYLVVAVVCKWIDDETFVRTIAALAPLQALAAATVGFFFGQKESNSH